jgi:hypothetical protein
MKINTMKKIKIMIWKMKISINNRKNQDQNHKEDQDHDKEDQNQNYEQDQDCDQKNDNYCHNPNFGLSIKARACKGEGQEGSPRVTSHVLRNVKECEGMNLTFPNELPLWELES